MTVRVLGSLFVILGSTSFGLFIGCGGLSGASLRATGSSCSYAGQCTSQSCNAPADGGCGTCVDIRALGQRCDGPLDGCSPSATCAGGVCTSSKKTLGESCTIGAKGEIRDCDDELYCGYDHIVSSMATCAPRGVLGGACEPAVGCAPGAQCEGGLCVVVSLGAEGDSCDERTCGSGLFCGRGPVCRPATLPVGADCGGPDFGLNGCVPGGSCWATGTPLPGEISPATCVPWVKEGERCYYENPCEEGLVCSPQEQTNDSRCVRRRPQAAGQRCGSLDGCVGGLECRAGVCAEPC